jgi:type II secretory pathway component PulM
MRPDRQRIVRELKKETCPQRVRDRVRGRIAARESARLRYVMPLAFAGVIVVCCLCLWQWQVHENARQQAKLAQLTIERARVARQAQDAMGLVGSVLLKAGAHSEKIISDRTVPQLRNSFETAKNKIIQNIDL